MSGWWDEPCRGLSFARVCLKTLEMPRNLLSSHKPGTKNTTKSPRRTKHISWTKIRHITIAFKAFENELVKTVSGHCRASNSNTIKRRPLSTSATTLKLLSFPSPLGHTSLLRWTLQGTDLSGNQHTCKHVPCARFPTLWWQRQCPKVRLKSLTRVVPAYDQRQQGGQQ